MTIRPSTSMMMADFCSGCNKERIKICIDSTKMADVKVSIIKFQLSGK